MARMIGKSIPSKVPADSSSLPEERRVLVKVRGIVQGVGFRPFIYQLAARYGLCGWVRNQSDGVEIEVAGLPALLRDFVADISAKAPPLSKVVSVEATELQYAPLEGFKIIASNAVMARSTLISPDACTCGDCLRELLDPEDRRFHYPFINCTNCGPRYTIIKDIPDDRPKTTMADFRMCPTCRREYDDPLDRRFHAQPNACWECGPRVWLEDSEGNTVCESDEAIKRTISLLDQGHVLAIKGLGGFHLAVKATDERAVSRLRGRKIREEKPFAVMFSNIGEMKRYCRVNAQEEDLLLSPARPIVLLTKCERLSGTATRAYATSREGIGLPVRVEVADGEQPEIAEALPRKTVILVPFYPIRPCISCFSRARPMRRWL